MEAGIGMQVSFQFLMPRPGPEAFGLCSSILAAGNTTCPVAGRAGFSLRKNGGLRRSCPLSGLTVLCFVPHLLCQPLEGMPPVCHPTLLGAHRNLANTGQ